MVRLEGTVTGVYISTQPDSIVSTSLTEVEANFEGFAGDKHSGLTMRSNSRTPFYKRGTEIRNTRQITIVSTEELAEAAAAMQLPQICPEWIGANLAVQGIPRLTHLPPMTRIFFPGDVVLLVTGENGPCVIAGRAIAANFPPRPGLAEQFPKATIHRRGVAAVVERPGLVRRGDQITVEIPDLLRYDE